MYNVVDKYGYKFRVNMSQFILGGWFGMVELGWGASRILSMEDCSLMVSNVDY